MTASEHKPTRRRSQRRNSPSRTSTADNTRWLSSGARWSCSPSVNRLYQEFQGKGFEVRMISFREDPALVRRTVQDRGYTAPILLDASGDVTGRLYGVFGPPTVYFIDRKGRLIARLAGPREWSGPAARAFVRAVLEEREPR